jgi:hypothetical protein
MPEAGMAEAFDPHDWYFVVRCAECFEYVPLGEAPPIDAPVEPKFVELRVICPHCGSEQGYRADEVSRQLRRVAPQRQ